MPKALSKTKVDLLGNRLRQGSFAESDLKLLDEYRRSFRAEYDTVIKVIRGQVGLEPTGRPAKSTSSIIEKLRRETIRLSQMQDIAGCRIIVDDVAAQEREVATLRHALGDVTVVDRRANPNHGYRAVHLVVRIADTLIEVQIRTKLQHLWAEISEKWSDEEDPAIKYGGGEQAIRNVLLNTSLAVAELEELEGSLASLPGRLKSVDKTRELEALMETSRRVLFSLFWKTLAKLDEGQEE